MFVAAAIRTIPVGAIAIALLYALYTAYYMFFTDYSPNDSIGTMYATFIVFLTVWYIDIESRVHTKIYRPYEYGLLVWTIWPLYIPYYLIKTRRAKGALLLLLIIAVIELDYLVYLAYWLTYE